MNAGMECLKEYACVSVWASDGIGEWGCECVFELMNKRKNELVNEWVTKLVFEWMS